MQRVRDIWQLVRGGNLVFIAILLWVMEKWVAVPVLWRWRFEEQLPWWLLLLLILATVLIAAGGYVVNDYFDVKIDRINRPDRLIVTQSVSKDTAMWLSTGLSSAGVVCGLTVAWVCRSWSLATIFVLVPGLLWFYSSSYKRLFLIGNLIVALTTALTPLLVALANVSLMQVRYANLMQFTNVPHDLYAWMCGFALFAFLCTLIREIIKDLQDQMGDRELECHTLPIRFGEVWTKVVVTILLLLTIGMIGYAWYAWLPFPREWATLSTRYIVFGLLTPLVCELVLLWTAKIPSDYRTAQLLMKFVMFMGVLYSFVVARGL